MKYLLLGVTMMAMMAGTASAGLKLPCGPSVGNWVNASPITCPFDSGNGLKKHVSRLKSAPPLIDEDDEGDGGGGTSTGGAGGAGGNGSAYIWYS